MKKFKLIVFTLVTFLCFSLIRVNAETIMVKNLEDYKLAIKNRNVNEIVIDTDSPILDIRRLKGSPNEDAITVDRNVVLDLKGHTILTGDTDNVGNVGVIKVFYYGNYTLTIKDSLKSGVIHSNCDVRNFSCDFVAPIIIQNTDDCNPETDNCDSKLILQDITFTTSSLKSFRYLINVGTTPNKSMYNIEISNVNFENVSKVTALFAHNNVTSPLLNLNIKSIDVNPREINYISQVSGYKVKDILDSTKKELLINGILVDPETDISSTDCDVSDGFIVRKKSVFDVIFDDAKYGYSGISAKPITINNNNSSPLKVKSVTVSDTNKFTISGNTQPTIAVGSTDNTSFSVKPVDGLAVGTHTATITVTDIDNKTFIANVTFEVTKADIEPVVSITGWSYGTTANSPSVTGNAGNGTVTYEYKVKNSADSTYSTTVPTEVGEYTIRATVEATTNYNGGVATASFIIQYKVTSGDGQKHIVGTNEDAIFRIDADINLFLKAYLNGEELDSAFYTVTEGSTIISLKQDFLNNLLPGTYNLKATFSDGGEANATFVVSSLDNPKTIDNIMLSIILGSISLIGLIGTMLFLKNKNT